MTTIPASTDVLIVGAGPVGMTAANLLGRYGINTLVIDREMEIFPLPRAIGTDNDGLRVLQAAGLPRDAFGLIPMPRLEMHTPHMGKVVEAALAGHINSFPTLAMFYQPDMETALAEAAKAHSSVQLVRGVEATSMAQDAQGARIRVKTLDGEEREIACQYVIAADGANSKFREWLGESFSGKDYAEEWLIVDVIGRDEEKHGPAIDHVMFYCNPHRPYPHMPAPGGRERWEFKIKKNEDPTHFLKDETIQELLMDWYPNKDAQIERKAIYKFQARAVKNFAHDRIFLAGDAAHVTPPFAGQGLVSGQRDVMNLAWKIAWVLKGLASPQILSSYDTERRPHVIATTRMARFIGAIVMPPNTLVEIAFHALVRLSNFIPALKRRLGSIEMKPLNSFAKGLFARCLAGNKIKPGSQLPQFRVIHKDGRMCWSDEVAEGALRFIGFGCDPYEHLDEAALAALKGMGGEVVQICYGHQVFHRPDHDLCWEDEDGNAIPGFAPESWCAVVRPDQVVMVDGPITDANQMVQQAKALLDSSERKSA